jgi:hypothetical protein
VLCLSASCNRRANRSRLSSCHLSVGICLCHRAAVQKRGRQVQCLQRLVNTRGDGSGTSATTGYCRPRDTCTECCLARCCRGSALPVPSGCTPIAATKSGAEGGWPEQCPRNRSRDINRGSSDGKKTSCWSPAARWGLLCRRIRYVQGRRSVWAKAAR